jgi:hypothetical protein
MSNVRCRTCNTELERPGDYCLVCNSSNCESVYVSVKDCEARIVFLEEESTVGEKLLPVRETTKKLEKTVERNYIGRIVDAIRRRRPSTVYLNMHPDRVRKLRSRISVGSMYLFEPQDDENEIEEVQNHMSTQGLKKTGKNPSDKLGGKHTTVIGDRKGKSTLQMIASCPFVKKIIPGPIDGGGNSGGGFRAEVTRSGESGNLRVLFKNGGIVQTIRVVTTASDRQRGSRVKEEVELILEDGLK